ncbi:hypothetical protein QNI16_35770 [Cytophagaceae bacterium YF14B1]|uniref:Uncharacterized protein n=1 Tax=Xanthocytophaga flava TaxID=3048013 RepID=A0AAE3QV04_9BACT|nr:hypothetical protein [Xanthocytophaga flavus]MDJ1485895.1 hypothetical protein [Xanthocytophaga flavus]
MKTLLLIVLTLVSLLPTISKAQKSTPLVVFESTLKVSAMGEEVFYYGFKAGDQLLIDLEEVKGKELKEFEVSEYPSSSKFMDYKTKKITGKTIQIQSTAIYKFRLSNSSISGRICKIKLQRIPADNQSFNSTVNWKIKYDTTFYNENEKYLVARDTIIENTIPQHVERVFSKTAINGKPNRSTVSFALPAGTISWSYYLGVGKDAEDCYRKAEEKAKTMKSTLTTAANLADGASKLIPNGSMAMAALALRGISAFTIPQADNVQFYITDLANTQLFVNGQTPSTVFTYGNGPLCYGQMKGMINGQAYFCLLNDNIREGIDVTIRLSAVVVRERWAERTVKKFRVATSQQPFLAGN